MKKSLIAAAAAAAIVGGSVGALSLAHAETPTPTPTPTVSSAAPSAKPTTSPSAKPTDHPGNGQKNGHRKGHGEMQMLGHLSKELATKLGVDEAKVTEAAKKVGESLREEYKNATTKPTMDEIEKKFVAGMAKELGLPEAKVQQAVTELKAAHQAEAEQKLQERLAQAVKDGKLTQAEADAVAKAIKNGVLPGGMGKGHR